MLRLLSILIATVSIQSPVSFRDLGGNACKFKVSASQSQPKVVGPTDIVERVVFLTQNDSPVEVLVADFTGATLDVGDGYFEFRDDHKFKIRNRSDRTVHQVDVMGYVADQTGGIGAGAVWEGELPPGGTAVLHVGGGHGGGGASDDEVRVFVGIESVSFDDCTYRPSRSISLKK